jgi:arylsulfatase A
MVDAERRKLLQLMTASTAALAVPFTVNAKATTLPTPRKTAPPKHVVFLICDDLGYGDLGCYGSSIPTPNLDRMANEGVLMSHCNSGHPLCSAARAAVLTGRYGTRSQTLNAFFPDVSLAQVPNTPLGMALDETTLANLFQRKGFRTHAVGKWHLGDFPEYLPTRRGFDSYYGVPYSVDMYPLPLIRNLDKIEADTDRNTLTQKYTAEAVSIINQADERPMFLYLGYSYPHDPVKASPHFRGKTGLGDYGDSVHEIDWSVGQILDALRKRQMLDDTLVIFTSDHGPWNQGDPGKLRGRKGSTYEGGFRVPLLARWTDGLPHGVKSETFISNLDWVPTLVKLFALESPPKPLDGVDIWPTLQGAAGEQERPVLLYFAPFGGVSMDVHCGRKGRWKLRVAQADQDPFATSPTKNYWLARPELYDLINDPCESYDVAEFHPDIVRSILAEIRALMPSFPSEIVSAFTALQKNVASTTTPTAALARPKSVDAHLNQFLWEPPKRRPPKETS